MFFYLLFISKSLDLKNFIDGLEYVEYQLDKDRQKAHFYVTDDNIILFYQNIPNFKLIVQNKGNKITQISNPYQLPKYSIVKVSTNWSQFPPNENYLMGFVNGEKCDYIFYSNSQNQTFQSKFFLNIKRCFYHFTKNSTIKIGNKKYTKFASIDNEYNDNFEIFSQNNYIPNTKINGLMKIEHTNKNILYDDDDFDDLEMARGGGSSMLAFAIILNIVGIILYLVFGLAFGTDSCDCTCKCCCCCKEFWEDHNITNLDYDNRKNPFFTETLEAFEFQNGKIKKGDDE